MKAVCQLLFLLFYVAASYAVTQERTSLIVQELDHSASRDDQTQIGQACKHLGYRFPNYRQAKPQTGLDLYLLNEAVHPLPQVSIRAFTAHDSSFGPIASLGGILTRAPPAQP